LFSHFEDADIDIFIFDDTLSDYYFRHSLMLPLRFRRLMIFSPDASYFRRHAMPLRHFAAIARLHYYCRLRATPLR
jgi:hypothetical protein